MSVPGIGPIISSAMVAAIRSGGGRSRLEAARLNLMVGSNSGNSSRRCGSACPFVARNGHGAMFELSLLSGVKLKSDFGAVRSAFDPKRTLAA